VKHLNRIPNGEIGPCKGKTTSNYMERYRKIYSDSVNRINANKRVNEAVADFAASRTEAAAEAYCASDKKVKAAVASSANVAAALGSKSPKGSNLVDLTMSILQSIEDEHHVK
jgi:hypothetical protein